MSGAFIAEAVVGSGIAGLAEEEHTFWQNGGRPIEEWDPKGVSRILAYLNATKIPWGADPRPGYGLPTSNPRKEGYAWSGVFVSYCVFEVKRRLSLTRNPLPPKGYHFDYAQQAYDNRKNGVAAYWAYRVDEQALAVGDIVVKWRGTPLTFQSLAGPRPRDVNSHADVVVAIQTDKQRARVIGGNVCLLPVTPNCRGLTVGERFYGLRSDGRIDTRLPHNNGADQIYTVLSLRGSLPAPQAVAVRATGATEGVRPG